MRRANLFVTAFVASLVGVSGCEREGDAGAVVRVLPSGSECELAGRVLPCSSVPDVLRETLALGRLATITVAYRAEDGSESHQGKLERELRRAGFWRVGIMKIGFIRLRVPASPG